MVSDCSKPTVNLVREKSRFDVVEDAFYFTEGTQSGGTHRDEVAMGHGEDDGVVSTLRGQLGQAVDTVYVPSLGAVDPGVVAVDSEAVLAQGLDDVDDAGVAQVRAVFLEGEAEDEDTTITDTDAVC